MLSVGIFSFVGVSDSNDVSYSDTWNLQSILVGESASPSSSSGGYMGNVGSGHTGSYTLEEALELQTRRISAAESSTASGTSYQNTNDETIGLAVGGAQDIDNFRKNIENNYLPLHTDITYEGLFYDYYFDTGNKQECGKLFCPSYSYAVSKDPFSKKDEYYLSVGLNSGLKEENFENAILSGINLGHDTDTTAAVIGGLAGIYYGFKNMPEHWVVSLARMEDIIVLGNKLNRKYF